MSRLLSDGNTGAGFFVKSDSLFFEGIAALLASIRFWHFDAPVRIVDCGLTKSQRCKLEEAGFHDIITPDLSQFSVAPEMDRHYTKAVYAMLACTDKLFDITVHIDADAVLLQPVSELLTQPDPTGTGLAAVPDYPPLGLDFQIGDNPGVRREVQAMVPDLRPNSISFNAGVFALTRAYFFERMNEMISRLLPLHDRLWGNEMAILNLAAFAASPSCPFKILHHTYNHRPHYRRAPELPPNVIEAYGSSGEPILMGHFGRIYILHFVGRDKPWHSHYDVNPSHAVWRFYRLLAARRYGI